MEKEARERREMERLAEERDRVGAWTARRVGLTYLQQDAKKPTSRSRGRDTRNEMEKASSYEEVGCQVTSASIRDDTATRSSSSTVSSRGSTINTCTPNSSSVWPCSVRESSRGWSWHCLSRIYCSSIGTCSIGSGISSVWMPSESLWRHGSSDVDIIQCTGCAGEE